MKILNTLKKAFEIKLIEEPVMQSCGKLDNYPKPTKKEIQRVERRQIR